MWLGAAGFSKAEIETFLQKYFAKGLTSEEWCNRENSSVVLMFSFAFITSVQEFWENLELKSEISSLPAEVHNFGSEVFLYFRKDLDALTF